MERIRESKYNKRYRKIAKEELPKYQRFRCGNETKAREYWKEDADYVKGKKKT